MASIQKLDRAGGGVTYRVMYRTPEGAQRSRSFKLAKEARTFAASVETTKAVGDYVDPQRAKITVGEWADKWVAGKLGIATSTRARYEDVIRAYIKPRWADVPLAKVTHEDIQDWLASLGLAAASIRKVHRVFSQTLGFAVKSGRLAKNPAEHIDLPRIRSKSKRFLTHDQVARLADLVGECRPDGALTGPPSIWRLVVLFLAYTGLRWGELAALRVRNVDLLHRRAVIEESYSPVRGKMVLSDTKGHARREVPIPKFLVADLEAQIQCKGPSDFLFSGPKGAILSAQTLRQVALPKASVQMGLCEPKKGKDGEPVMTGFLTPHELRHTAASLAIASGADVKVVQQMLGHKSATMTLDLYGHLFPDRLDEVADAMDAARTAALGASMASTAGVRIQVGRNSNVP